LTYRQFEEMQHDNAAQRVTLQKAPAKSSFLSSNIDLSKSASHRHRHFYLSTPTADWVIILSIVGEKPALIWCSLADGSATRTSPTAPGARFENDYIIENYIVNIIGRTGLFRTNQNRHSF
jgi:hypothetical protein